MIRSATLSDCGVYRYSLERIWGAGILTWVMLNPSTADADVDDPTIRRVISFTKSFGYGGARVLNLFALRATNPAELKEHPDPVGPLNDLSVSGPIVCAWGAHKMTKGLSVEGDTYCLGITKDGSPKHPLYVPGSQMLVPFR